MTCPGSCSALFYLRQRLKGREHGDFTPQREECQGDVIRRARAREGVVVILGKTKGKKRAKESDRGQRLTGATRVGSGVHNLTDLQLVFQLAVRL